MIKEENKFLLEILGAIAVIVSLLFLAYQIQQTNEIARVTTEYEIRNNYTTLNELLMTDEELANLLIKTRTVDASELDVSERMMLGSWVRRSLNVWFSVEQAYAAGLLSEETYSAIFEDAQNELSIGVGMRPIWRTVLDLYQGQADVPVFSYVNELLNEYGTEAIPL